MRTKALILGARPKPFEGEWVPINEKIDWKGTCTPGAESVVSIEVLDTDGVVEVFRPGERFRGSRARGIIGSPVALDVMSIILKEV